MKEFNIGRKHGSVVCSLLSPSPLAIWHKLNLVSSLNKMLLFPCELFSCSFFAYRSRLNSLIRLGNTGIRHWQSALNHQLCFGNIGSWSLTLQRPSFEEIGVMKFQRLY